MRTEEFLDLSLALYAGATLMYGLYLHQSEDEKFVLPGLFCQLAAAVCTGVFLFRRSVAIDGWALATVADLTAFFAIILTVVFVLSARRGLWHSGVVTALLCFMMLAAGRALLVPEPLVIPALYNASLPYVGVVTFLVGAAVCALAGSVALTDLLLRASWQGFFAALLTASLAAGGCTVILLRQHFSTENGWQINNAVGTLAMVFAGLLTIFLTLNLRRAFLMPSVKKRSLAIARLQKIAACTTLCGVGFLQAGILLSRFWSEQLWGRDEAWSPYLLGAIMSGFSYVVFLILATGRDGQGQSVRWFAVSGLLAILATTLALGGLSLDSLRGVLFHAFM